MLEIINLILIVVIIIVLVVCIIKSRLNCLSGKTTVARVETDKSDAIKTAITSVIKSDDVVTTPIVTKVEEPVVITPVSTACVGITSTGATCIGNLESGNTSALPKPKVAAFVLTNDSVVTTPDHTKLVTDLKASNQNGVIYVLDSAGNITTNFQIVESAVSGMDLVTFLTQNPILKTSTIKSSELAA
jgi:hypothetical protein